MMQQTKIHSDAWKPNQRATLVQIPPHGIKVNRNQPSSTPGITTEVSVKKGERYSFEVEMSGNCQLKFYVADSDRKIVSTQPKNADIRYNDESSISFLARQDGLMHIGVLMRQRPEGNLSDPHLDQFTIVSATLKKIERKSGAVASLATMPSRLSTLPETLASIYDQVDHIFIHLNKFDSVPDFLDRPEITVTRSQELGDLRDTGKFVALREVDDDTLFFTIDDDIIYPANYVQRMTSCLDRFDRRIIAGVHGVIYPFSPTSFFNRMAVHFKKALPVDLPVSCLGTGTVAFRAGFFRPDIASFERHGMADLYTAAFANKANIPLISVSRRSDWLYDATNPGMPEESLYQETQKDSMHHNKVLRDSGHWGFSRIGKALDQLSASSGKHGLSNEARAFINYGIWVEGGCHGNRPKVPLNEISVELSAQLGSQGFLRESMMS